MVKLGGEKVRLAVVTLWVCVLLIISLFSRERVGNFIGVGVSCISVGGVGRGLDLVF